MAAPASGLRCGGAGHLHGLLWGTLAEPVDDEAFRVLAEEMRKSSLMRALCRLALGGHGDLQLYMTRATRNAHGRSVE